MRRQRQLLLLLLVAVVIILVLRVGIMRATPAVTATAAATCFGCCCCLRGGGGIVDSLSDGQEGGVAEDGGDGSHGIGLGVDEEAGEVAAGLFLCWEKVRGREEGVREMYEKLREGFEWLLCECSVFGESVVGAERAALSNSIEVRRMDAHS